MNDLDLFEKRLNALESRIQIRDIFQTQDIEDIIDN